MRSYCAFWVYVLSDESTIRFSLTLSGAKNYISAPAEVRDADLGTTAGCGGPDERKRVVNPL